MIGEGRSAKSWQLLRFLGTSAPLPDLLSRPQLFETSAAARRPCDDKTAVRAPSSRDRAALRVQRTWEARTPGPRDAALRFDDGTGQDSGNTGRLATDTRCSPEALSAQTTPPNIAMKLIGTPACTRLRRGNPSRQQLIATLGGHRAAPRAPAQSRSTASNNSNDRPRGTRRLLVLDLSQRG